MRDIGVIKNDEPANRLFTQGMVIKDGAKMSKSLGNVVSPDDMVAQYGADSARMYSLFAAPPDRDLDWQEDGVSGINRFLGRAVSVSLPGTRDARPEGARCGPTRADESGTAQTAPDDREDHATISTAAGTSIHPLPR